MPLKDIKEFPEMFIHNPDGTKIKIGKIQSAKIVTDYDDPIYGTYAFIPRLTTTFEIEGNPTIDTVFLLIHGRLPSNNW